MPDSGSSSSSSATPWQAQSATRITRPTADGLVEQISYDGDGRFTRRFLATPGHLAPRLVQLLDASQLRALQAQLQAQTQASAHVATQDTSNFSQFMRQIEDTLRNLPAS